MENYSIFSIFNHSFWLNVLHNIYSYKTHFYFSTDLGSHKYLKKFFFFFFFFWGGGQQISSISLFAYFPIQHFIYFSIQGIYFYNPPIKLLSIVHLSIHPSICLLFSLSILSVSISLHPSFY